MQQAQLLVEQMPDSALTLLGMANTATFSKAAKAEYTLLRVQAKDNAEMDISSDTEILQAREYFMKKNDVKKKALACFYAAKVVFGDRQTDQALIYFREAADFAETLELKVLQGRALYNMGYLYHAKEMFTYAITYYRQALTLFQTVEDQYRMEIYTWNAIGNALMIEEQTDSAQYYYSKAMQLALQHDDAEQQMMVYINIGVAYRELGETETAMYYNRKALNMAITDSYKAYIYQNFAHLHLIQNRADSARYFLEMTSRLIAEDELNRWVTLYHLYALIENTCGNYQKAMEYHELHAWYREALIERNDKKLLLEMHRKYDDAVHENQYNKEKRRWWQMVYALSVLLMTLAAVAMALQKKNRKQKALLAITAQEKLKAEQQLQILQNMYHNQPNEMKNRFFRNLEIIKDISSLQEKKKLPPEKFLHEINLILKKYTIKTFIQTTNVLYPRFTEKLKEHFQEVKLTELETATCCLIVCGFTSHDIAFLIYKDLKKQTIEKLRIRIRKKLKITIDQNFQHFLLEIYRKKP